MRTKHHIDLMRLLAHIESDPTPPKRLRRYDRSYAGITTDRKYIHTIWTACERYIALDLEREGHRSPNRIPPADLASLVSRGDNA